MKDDYDDYDNEACANCGGEGFTRGCSWGWQCDTWDGDSCRCTRRCEWCNPLTDSEIAERQEILAELATALAKDKVAGMRAAQAMEAREGQDLQGLDRNDDSAAR